MTGGPAARQPLVPVCLAFMAGLGVQNYFLAGMVPWLIVSAAGAGGLMIFRRAANFFLVLLVAGSAGLYAESRQAVSGGHVSSWQRYYRKNPAVLRGVIRTDPQRKLIGTFDKTTFQLSCVERQAPGGWRPCDGTVLVQLFKPHDLRYGDYIELQGRLHRPFQDDEKEVFSYQEYLRNRGIDFILSVKKAAPVIRLDRGHGFFVKAIGIQWRRYFAGVFDRYLSPNESGLMKAMLLGDRAGVPLAVNDLFKRTGSAHILAISGLHIGILGGLLMVWIRLIPVGRRVHYGLVVVSLLLYLVVTGERASVWRATLMAVVVLGGLLFEREDQRWNTLALAAVVLLLMNPRNLFDLGFLLSFGCVVSIFAMMPFFNSLSGIKRRFFRWLAQSFSLSLSVWLGVWPVIALAFGVVTPVAVVANLWVIPWVTVVLSLGAVLMMAGGVFPWLAEPLAMCLKASLNLLVAGVYVLDMVPGAAFYFRGITLWFVCGYYAAAVPVIFWFYRRMKGVRIERSLIDKANQLC